MRLQSNYEKALLEARNNFLLLDNVTLQEVDDILVNAHKEISDILDVYDSPAGLQRARLLALQQDIEASMEANFLEMQKTITKDMELATRVSAQGHINAGKVLLEQFNIDAVRDVIGIFAKVPNEALRAALARKIKGATFSDRIWDIEQYGTKSIMKVVQKGMILGTNAEQLAKELEPFLKMRGKMWKTYQEKQMEQAGISWIKPIQTEGSLNYNCFRLARTEINNSYREANIISAEKAPWVKGVKWILSGAHVVPDICDTWASQDLYKLGAGCYPPAKTPVDHPNGLCHLNDILVSRNELLDILENRYKKAA